jgi:hypothetical protein
MDDELEQLEAELKALRPAAVPPRLVAQIERQLTVAPARTRHRVTPLFWLWTALPAAAALAVAIGVAMHREVGRSRPATRPAQVGALPDNAAVLKPVAAENVLYSATDEGLVTLEDGTRARRERLNYVDTITWVNPRTNASLKWSVPREEVRVVPVSFQ